MEEGEEEEEEEEEEEFAPHPDCESTILFINRPTGGTMYMYVYSMCIHVACVWVK